VTSTRHRTGVTVRVMVPRPAGGPGLCHGNPDSESDSESESVARRRRTSLMLSAGEPPAPAPRRRPGGCGAPGPSGILVPYDIIYDLTLSLTVYDIIGL
jgi:hypothetical protein